ncbi:hypothetical protein QJS04_geneDACA005517 [Acorus gramineus]|uniref:DEVIL-like protein n=1 Tax=Acorus gramineus TaxID=55184 RepID=A0AAV9A5I2_ACOGR|nr:hypothetical protein QJS04_geneDACA005517 [Acorus gramineus]
MAGAMAVSYIHQATQTRRRQPPSHRRSSGGLGKKCMSMVKQQKTRFYILGRCVTMLLCWHADD